MHLSNDDLRTGYMFKHGLIQDQLHRTILQWQIRHIRNHIDLIKGIKVDIDDIGALLYPFRAASQIKDNGTRTVVAQQAFKPVTHLRAGPYRFE